MKQIGRNDPCLCGSGIKYKHCCASKTLSIIDILKADVTKIQQEIVQYAVMNYEPNITSCLESFFGELVIKEDDDFEKIDFILMLWVTFALPIASKQQTIVQEYIEKHGRKIMRPKLREAVQLWQDARPSIYKVIEEQQHYLVVEDLFTGNGKGITLIQNHEPGSSIKNQYLLATVIEYANRSSFFMTYYLMKDPSIVDEILALYENYQEHYTGKEFIDELFPDVAEIIFAHEPKLEDLDWDTPQQKQVLDLFKEKLQTKGELRETFINIGTAIWKTYCLKTGGKIRNVTNYAASLHFTIGYFCLFFGEDDFTKKEIVTLYNIKPRALTDTLNKFSEIMEDVINEMIEEITFGFEEDEDDFFDIDNDLFLEEDNEEKPVDELAIRRKAKQKNYNY